MGIALRIRVIMKVFLLLSLSVAAALGAWVDDGNCGISRYANAGVEGGAARIVGGWKARAHEFPYQISLRYRNSHMCGGSIITNRYILTAAHCTEGTRASDLSVVVAETNIVSGNSNRQVIGVRTIIEHENYDETGELDNDIALLRLSSTISFNQNQSPVCPPTSQSYTGEMVTVSGWGTTSEGGSLARDLLYTNVRIISDSTCGQSYPSSWLLPGMVCASFTDRDSCQGDSGGPLVIKRSDNRFAEVGIVSWGIGCADRNYPGVYTRVSYFMNWINNNI